MRILPIHVRFLIDDSFSSQQFISSLIECMEFGACSIVVLAKNVFSDSAFKLLKSLGYSQTQSESNLVKVEFEQNHKGFAVENSRDSRQRFETGGGTWQHVSLPRQSLETQMDKPT